MWSVSQDGFYFVLLVIISIGGAERSGKHIFFNTNLCETPVRIRPSEKQNMNLSAVHHMSFTLSSSQTDKRHRHEIWWTLKWTQCRASQQVHKIQPRVVSFQKPHCWSPPPSEKSPKQVTQPRVLRQLNTREWTELYNFIVQPRPETQQPTHSASIQKLPSGLEIFPQTCRYMTTCWLLCSFN